MEDIIEGLDILRAKVISIRLWVRFLQGAPKKQLKLAVFYLM